MAFITTFQASLGKLTTDKVLTEHVQSVKEPRLWLFGYGDWVSPASATIIGAGRSARENVPALVEFLKEGS